MSINRNRAKLNKAHNGKEYKTIQYDLEYPLYWDEGISLHGVGLMSYQIRMYRNWKNSRKNRWK